MTSPPATTISRLSSPVAYALWYAQLGLRVVPFHHGRKDHSCSCRDGLDCPKVGKHPRVKDWRDKATTNPEAIKAWWDTPGWTYSNVTILTGNENDRGVVVLDFDGPEGLRTLSQLEREYEPFPVTPRSRSGGGGLHLWFLHPGRNVVIPTGDGLLGPAGDVKGDGGAITVPPSTHRSGNLYQWLEHDLENTLLAKLPDWTIEAIQCAFQTGKAPISARSDGTPYAYRTTFQGKAYELPSSIGDGGRNRELYTYACSLRAKGAYDTEIESALAKANSDLCNPPLHDRELEWILKSAIKFPAGDRRGDPLDPSSKRKSDGPNGWQPRIVAPPPEPPPWFNDALPPPDDSDAPDDGPDHGGDEPPTGHGGGGGGGGGKKPPQATVLQGPDGIPMTDLGNAERVYRDAGEDLRYVGQTDRWHVWTGTHWRYDQMGTVLRKAAVTARRMHPGILNCRDEDHEKKWRAHIKSSESIRGIRSAVDCLGFHRGITRRSEDLDRGVEDVINTPTGILDLKTLELRPHAREPMITKIAAAPYLADAECPTWLAFLDQTFGGDQEMIAFIQRLMGYCLTGRTTEQCLFFFYGIGRNGKSTLVEAFRRLMGDYGRVADFSTFMDRPNDTARYDLASLWGSRLVTAGEPNLGQRFSEGTVKTMTGGEKITCRYLRGNFFEYLPEYKVILSANHMPTVRGQDDGIWRRFRIVPFDLQVSEEDKDKLLPQKLQMEWPGIFAWVARGARAWYQDGLDPPQKVLTATADYRSSMDFLTDFFAEFFDIVEPAKNTNPVEAVDVYTKYKVWCERAGERVLAKRTLGCRLKERGYASIKKSGRRVYPMLREK